MRRCKACGKEFEVLWPELWRYRRKFEWFCSWSCYRKNEKGVENMERIKKDGTPAMRPGRKPGTQKKEPEQKVELVYDPDIAEEYRREQEQKKANEKSKEEALKAQAEEQESRRPLEVYAIKSRVLKDGYYKRNHNGEGMYLYGLSVQQEQVGLMAANWKKLSEEILQALTQLNVQEPKQMETEGGGTTYWNVCPDCHGAIDRGDRYCRHCGLAVRD